MSLVVGSIYWTLNGMFLYTCHLGSGKYWRHGGVLLHTCHSPWVAYTGDLMACSSIHVTYELVHTGDMVVCSCVYVTHCGWHVWSHSSVLVRTCHSLWVTCTGVMVACSCLHVTHCGRHVLEVWYSCIHDTYKGHALETWCSCIYGTYEVTRTRGLVLCFCIHVSHFGWHVLKTWWSTLAYMLSQPRAR